MHKFIQTTIQAQDCNSLRHVRQYKNAKWYQFVTKSQRHTLLLLRFGSKPVADEVAEVRWGESEVGEKDVVPRKELIAHEGVSFWTA